MNYTNYINYYISTINMHRVVPAGSSAGPFLRMKDFITKP